MSAIQIQGTVNGSSRLALTGTATATLDVSGSVRTHNTLPTEAELNAMGYGAYVIGTAVTNLVAIPTTAAALTLFNNGTNTLIVAAVGTLGTATSAAVGQITPLVRMDVVGQNVNPVGALIIGGTSGKLYAGLANAKASVTLAAIGAANNVAWMPAGQSVTNQATSIGTNSHCECYGRWIIKPQGCFSVQTLAYAASGSSQPYIYFYDVPGLQVA